MPYIKQEDRDNLELDAKESGDFFPCALDAGELNYVITKVVLEYIHAGDPVNYQKYNDCIGALECAKLELYRRRISEYEDKKINENGDVYPEVNTL